MKPGVQPKTSVYFPSVDILRGFAALSVVVYHVIEHYRWSAFPTEGLLVWFRIGWMGVDLFFIISGLVIGLSVFAEIDRSGTAGFRRPFMRRRLVRIAPLHYFTCLIFVAMVGPQLLFENFWANAVMHLLFLHNLVPSFHGAINGPNWSLGVEVQFYVFVLLLAPWIQRVSICKMLVVLVSVAWAWRFGCTLVFPVQGEQGVWRLFFVSTQLPGSLDEFAAGLLLAKLFRSERGGAWLRASPIWSILGASAAVWIALIPYWRFTYWDSPSMVVFCRTLLAIALCAVVFASCTLNSARWLQVTAPLRYLGTISFGIYLWHLPVLLTLKELTWLEPQRALPIVLALTLSLAAVSWHFFEKPLIERSLDRKLLLN